MVSPNEIDYEESVCTLRYASRAKYIKNHVRINFETKRGLIEAFEHEIAELQKRVAVISLEEEQTVKPVTCVFLNQILQTIFLYFVEEEGKRKG